MVGRLGFVPRSGQSMFDLAPPAVRQRTERRLPQSIQCFQMPLTLTRGETRIPRSYVYCTRIAPADTFRQFANRAKTEPGWHYVELDASHSPHVTAPDALLAMLRMTA